MIMNFLKKVPAGMMIVPLLIGAILNTFCSSVLQVGSLTTATFSNAGAATAMGIQLVQSISPVYSKIRVQGMWLHQRLKRM